MKIRYVRHPGIDILSEKISNRDEGLFVLHHENIEKHYDLVIASAHYPSAFMEKKNDRRLVIVVSYVPPTTSKEWPGFYTNICMSDILACDSFVLAELQKLTFPEKLHIPLDGCSVIKPYAGTISSINTKLKLVPLDADKAIWEKFVPYILDKRPDDFAFSAAASQDCIGIAFYPLGSMLANVMVHSLEHISVANTDASFYLDSRHVNNIKRKVGNLVHVAGGASGQAMREQFEIFSEELFTIVNHIRDGNRPFRYTSNVNIFDRIFHEVNKLDLVGG